MVTSGRTPGESELEAIASMVGGVGEEGLLPCATLGLLGEEELTMLKDAGLYRYHHNLETSRRFFPEVCTSHSYDDKLGTIEAKGAGYYVLYRSETGEEHQIRGKNTLTEWLREHPVELDVLRKRTLEAMK